MGQFHFDPDTYLAMMHSEVPRYEELQDVVARQCRPVDGVVGRVLDLGTGTGETARRVLASCPGATLVGVDESERMLGGARRVLDPVRVTTMVGRIEDELPPGTFDVVCSALSVHHLDGQGKRSLFRRVAASLRPGGRFVLGDVVVVDDDTGIAPVGQRTPVDAANDKPDSADDQLRWLAEAGMGARLAWTAGDLAVLVADLPPG